MLRATAIQVHQRGKRPQLGWRLALVAGFALANLLVARSTDAQPPSAYFSLGLGDVPILISAPHGGTLDYPFDERSCTGSQVCVLDTNTRQLALATRTAFYDLTGYRPYMIAARGSRNYIDFNRSASQAYDDPDAAPYFDFYHDTIDDYISDVREKYGYGLLIDLHGQSADVDVVIRGTKNGLTVSEMLGRDGEQALNGPNSLLGALDDLGYTAAPDVDVPFAQQTENPNFDGGYIVQDHGSHQPDGIDAIQLEFGFDFRGGTAWQQTAEDLAAALWTYTQAYLPGPLLPGDYNGDQTVDAADYTVWRDSQGSSNSDLVNNINGPTINGDHYQTWRQHYGETSGGWIASPPQTVSIPEPTSGVMLLLAMLWTTPRMLRL